MAHGLLATADWELVSLPVQHLAPEATQLARNPCPQKDKAVSDKEVSDRDKEGDQDVEREQSSGESRGEGTLLLSSNQATSS